jgi:hypothetical protein
MGALNATVAYDSHNSGWIEDPLNHTMQVLSASLPDVDTGTIVEVRSNASAESCPDSRARGCGCLPLSLRQRDGQSVEPLPDCVP